MNYSNPSRHLFAQSQQWKHQNNVWNLLKICVNDVVLVSLLSALSRFHTLFWCFHCWLWTSKYRLGQFLNIVSTNPVNTYLFKVNNGNSRKILRASAKGLLFKGNNKDTRTTSLVFFIVEFRHYLHLSKLHLEKQKA